MIKVLITNRCYDRISNKTQPDRQSCLFKTAGLWEGTGPITTTPPQLSNSNWPAVNNKLNLSKLWALGTLINWDNMKRAFKQINLFRIVQNVLICVLFTKFYIVFPIHNFTVYFIIWSCVTYKLSLRRNKIKHYISLSSIQSTDLLNLISSYPAGYSKKLHTQNREYFGIDITSFHSKNSRKALHSKWTTY